MSVAKKFVRKVLDLLKLSHRFPNFAKQANTERKAFVKLLAHQSMMLDEYETLVAEYDKQLNPETQIQSNE